MAGHWLGDNTVTRRLASALFGLLLAAFLATSLAYNVATPAGEGVDELPHLRYVWYLRTHHALPVLPSWATPETVFMGHHPPLYYLVAALVLSLFSLDHLTPTLPTNPHFTWIEGYGPGNRNVYLHSPQTGADPFPYQGIILLIHALRLLSTLQGIGAVIVTRSLLRALLANRPGLVLIGTAAAAFQPTFISTFNVVNNDATVALLILLGLLWLIRCLDHADRGQPLPSTLVGGGIAGLALLAKTDALILGPTYLVGFALVAFRTRKWAPLLRKAIGTALVALAVAGWWYLRNLLLYGDLFAQNVFATTHPSLIRTGAYQIGDFLAFVQQLRRTYWGSFGYMHILVDQRIGDTLWLIVALALPSFAIGLITDPRDRRTIAGWTCSVVVVGALVLLFIRYSLVVGGVGHGRFFVAAMPIVAAATTRGLAWLFPWRWPVAPALFAGAVVIYGIVAPFAVIAPAYRPPVSTADVAGQSTPIAVFGGQLALASARLPSTAIPPGGIAAISLFWQRASPITGDLQIRLRARARDGTIFFDQEFWPAGGGIPTTTWPEGVRYRDDLSIPVPANVAPGLASLSVSVRDANGSWLDAGGRREMEIGRIAIAEIPIVSALPATSTLINATLGA